MEEILDKRFERTHSVVCDDHHVRFVKKLVDSIGDEFYFWDPCHKMPEASFVIPNKGTGCVHTACTFDTMSIKRLGEEEEETTYERVVGTKQLKRVAAVEKSQKEIDDVERIIKESQARTLRRNLDESVQTRMSCTEEDCYYNLAKKESESKKLAIELQNKLNGLQIRKRTAEERRMEEEHDYEDGYEYEDEDAVEIKEDFIPTHRVVCDGKIHLVRCKVELFGDERFYWNPRDNVKEEHFFIKVKNLDEIFTQRTSIKTMEISDVGGKETSTYRTDLKKSTQKSNWLTRMKEESKESTDMRALSVTETPTKKEEKKTMKDTSDIAGTTSVKRRKSVKQRFKESTGPATYRFVGQQVVEAAKSSIVSLLEPIKEPWASTVRTILDTKYGESFLALAIGTALAMQPHEDERIDTLADELIVSGEAVGADALFGEVVKRIMPIVTAQMKQLPVSQSGTMNE